MRRFTRTTMAFAMATTALLPMSVPIAVSIFSDVAVAVELFPARPVADW